MNKPIAFSRAVLAFAFAAVAMISLPAAMAADGHVLDQDANAALQHLYGKSPGAKALSETAKGVLVFPDIRKAAFIVGAQGGDGVLFEKGKPSEYYNSGALSVGVQAGVTSYGYALFFMSDADLEYLKKSKGWSLGVGPSIVVVDAGAAKDISTMTGKAGVYAFIFDQKGLMAGLSLVGQKITKINR